MTGDLTDLFKLEWCMQVSLSPLYTPKPKRPLRTVSIFYLFFYFIFETIRILKLKFIFVLYYMVNLIQIYYIVNLILWTNTLSNSWFLWSQLHSYICWSLHPSYKVVPYSKVVIYSCWPFIYITNIHYGSAAGPFIRIDMIWSLNQGKKNSNWFFNHG